MQPKRRLPALLARPCSAELRLEGLGKAGPGLVSKGSVKANPAHLEIQGSQSIFLAVLVTSGLSQRQGKKQCPFVSSLRQPRGRVHSYKGSICGDFTKSLKVHGCR